MNRVFLDREINEQRPRGIDFIAKARELAPMLEKASPRIEAERRLTDDVLAALHEARMFRLILPRSFDGEEVEPPVFVRVMEEIAKGDASAAWCMGQGSGCSVSAAYVKPEVAREVFGDRTAVMASGPTMAKAVIVDGGYRVTGTWAFASGMKHCAWFGGHCHVYEADGTTLRRNADGSPFERTMLFPKSVTTITEIWDVMGLKGTGSDQYAVKDLFVPADYSYTRENETDRREQGPLYRIAIFQIYAMGFTAVSLGIARAALDAFIALAADKVPRALNKVLRESTVVQTEVAVSEAKLQAARALFHQTIDEVWDEVKAGGSVTLEHRVKLRMVTTFAIHQARDVMDTVYHAAGSSSVFASNPFERRFRDMHTACQQLQGHAANFIPVGQYLLGLEPSLLRM
jgi:indole-3-acetate monooxygenase